MLSELTSLDGHEILELALARDSPAISTTRDAKINWILDIMSQVSY